MPDPEQPRKNFDPQELAELANSIRTRGIKEPITVRWDSGSAKWMIIDGERRFRAAAEAGVDTLPCWAQKAQQHDVLIDQIVHNWQRSNLRPYETADALARLRDKFGMTVSELSTATGKRKPDISKLLSLHDKVIPKVQELARSESGEGTLTRRQLYSISQLPPERQLDVAEKVRNGQMSADATEKLVARRRVNRKARGLSARQRRFNTSLADVVMTFRRATISDADVRAVIREIEAHLNPADSVSDRSR